MANLKSKFKFFRDPEWKVSWPKDPQFVEHWYES